MTSELDRIKPVEFPLRWLTYRKRTILDLDRAYASEGGEEFFNADYIARLSAQAKQLEEWAVKLLITQIALTGFQVIGFFGTDASISLFGITLKQATGVKELLISFYCTVAFVTWMILISKETTLTLLDRLAELSSDLKFNAFAKLATSTSFNLKFYAPQQYENWIFETRAGKIIFGALATAATLLLLAMLSFSVAMNVAFFLDIYHHPTLGVWSKVVLVYVALTISFGVLFLLRFYFPQPYRDSSVLLALKALEEADPRLHRQQLNEIYGPNSKYRKFTISHRATMMRAAIGTAVMAPWRKLRSTLRKVRDHI